MAKGDMDVSYTMRQARDIIRSAILNPLQHSNRTIYLEGSPGLGKTALCHSLFDEFKRTPENPEGFTHFLPYVAPEREPTEWGLPLPNKDRTAIYMMPLSEFVWNPTDRVFFLIDEIDKANNMMQNVLGRVAHEHQVHNVKLPKNSFVIMAGNKLTDRAGGFSANSHIKNRRTHTPVMADYKEWIEDVAIPQGYHSAVISYLRANPGMLHKFDPGAPSFPSPRSWSKVGEQLNVRMEAHVERAFIEGDIGKETANTFWGHLKIHRDLRSPETIIKDPEGASIPSGANSTPIMWAEVTSLARYAEKQNAEAIFRYFNRLPGEFGFVGYKDVLLRDRKLVSGSRAGQAWIVKNAAMLNQTKADN